MVAGPGRAAAALRTRPESVAPSPRRPPGRPGRLAMAPGWLGRLCLLLLCLCGEAAAG